MSDTDKPEKSKDKSPEKDFSESFTRALAEASLASFDDAYKGLQSVRDLAGLPKGGLDKPSPKQDISANLPDGAHTDESGRLTSLIKGGIKGDSYFVTYGNDGKADSISINVGGHSAEFQAGKDFIPGSVKAGADGTITFVKPDGKESVTLTKDFSFITKEIGDKPDGSADRIIHVKTAEGAERSIRWEPVPNGAPGEQRIASIEDRLHTNSGKDLVTTTTRIGGTNNWQVSAFGQEADKTQIRTNVALRDNGDFLYDTIKISRPNDLVNEDNKDSRHNVAEARKHFIDTARKNGVSIDGSLDGWCSKFEQRCYKLAHQSYKAPTDSQISETYRQLEKILEGHGHMPMSQRKRLMKDALHDIADPNHYINQYQHPSCAFASASRIVVQSRPDSYVRVLAEMANNGAVRSAAKMANADTMYNGQKDTGGKYKTIKFGEQQLTPHNDWPSFSNQLFQTFAIKCGYPGYRGWGMDDFPGGDEYQMSRVKKFATGDGHLHLVNGWSGQTGSFEQVQKNLKRDGACAYFWPGHALAIVDARIKNGRKQVLVDNWWGNNGQKGASADGWYDWGRIGSLGS